MTRWELERYKHYMHHHVVVHLKDGSTKEGYMQPFDDKVLCVTALNGTDPSNMIPLQDIRRLEFPSA